MDRQNNHPLIFDIHHFALDDGPGIRTTVFFKGCPLSCIWCHNPESVKSSKETAFYHQKCIRCGECIKACRQGAIDISTEHIINRQRCLSCGNCAEACPSTALQSVGKYYTADNLTDILLRDRYFYETSKGGITFSGGEPTLHMDFLREVMINLKRENIHMAIQTCGVFDFDSFKEKILPYINLIYFDIKLIDTEKHKKYTGMGNEMIISNFKDLLELSRRDKKFKIITRTPVIPVINDSSGDIDALNIFYKTLNHRDYEFMKYNPGGYLKRAAISGMGTTNDVK